MSDTPAHTPAPHVPPDVLKALAHEWWLIALRGAASVLFGILVFAFPLMGVLVVIAMLAAWFLIDGVLGLWHAFTGPRPEDGRGWHIFHGVVDIAAGLALLFLPGLSALTLVFVAAGWSIITGVLQIVEAFKGQSRFGSPWLLGIAGVAGVVVGILLLAAPGPGLIALMWMIAIQAIVFGIALLAMGFRLRRIAK